MKLTSKRMPPSCQQMPFGFQLSTAIIGWLQALQQLKIILFSIDVHKMDGETQSNEAMVGFSRVPKET